MRQTIPAQVKITCDFCNRSNQTVPFNMECAVFIKDTWFDACIKCQRRLIDAAASTADKIRRENS